MVHGGRSIILNNSIQPPQFRFEATQEMRFAVTRISRQNDAVTLAHLIDEKFIELLRYVQRFQIILRQNIRADFGASRRHGPPEFNRFALISTDRSKSIE